MIRRIAESVTIGIIIAAYTLVVCAIIYYVTTREAR